MNSQKRSREAPKGAANSQVIGIGSRVSVRDLGSGELEVFTLVLPADTDISRHMISSFAPLGGAILGRQAGDVVEFDAPGGRMKFRIESVQDAPIAESAGQLC